MRATRRGKPRLYWERNLVLPVVFSLKALIRKLLIDLDVGVFGEAVVSARLKELLLHGDAAGRVNPEQDARNIILNASGFRDELQLSGGDSIGGILAEEFHVVGFEQVVAAASEPKH